MKKYYLPYSICPIKIFTYIKRDINKIFNITLYELMQRAGKISFRYLRFYYPNSKNWIVLCGQGNNGSNGYIIAYLAKKAGLQVTLIGVYTKEKISKEAQLARDFWLSIGGIIQEPNTKWPENIDLIIDALLGIGTVQEPRAPYDQLISYANHHPAPIFSIDIPSGLIADNGAAFGETIYADRTITFIALKLGLFTGRGRDFVGKLHYNSLGLDTSVYVTTPSIVRCNADFLNHWFQQPRRSTSHKGEHGKLLIIGGDYGMGGAVRLTAEAALRSGAGIVKVLTHKNNITSLLTARPELIVQELTTYNLDKGLAWANIITIGPGLGQRPWGKNALKKVKNAKKSMLWDADALNLLALDPDKRDDRIITPHACEAARLLNVKTIEIETNRLVAIKRLVKCYGGVVVLKGAGTLIASETGEIAIADVGNAGMASGGMGDVLSGIISSLLGQHFSLFNAASAGCVVHGTAGDIIEKKYGNKGMLASDLFYEIYLLVNLKNSIRKNDGLFDRFTQ